MYVNRSHPCLSRGPRPAGYDIALEVLMSLPLRMPAQIEILSQDFGETQESVRRIVNELADDYGVRNDLDGVRVPKDPRLLVAMIEATERYYDQVHKPYDIRRTPRWKQRALKAS
jgi:hypothetical protein